MPLAIAIEFLILEILPGPWFTITLKFWLSLTLCLIACQNASDKIDDSKANNATTQKTTNPTNTNSVNAQIIDNSSSSYKFNSSIQEIENADAILLIGSNPRWEAAVLNARIRKAYIENNCKIGLIGPKLNLTYQYEHLSD